MATAKATRPAHATRHAHEPTRRRFGFIALLTQVHSGLIAEYSRAAEATRRYDELKRTGPVVLHPVKAGGIPRAIFEEFYNSDISWRS